MGRKAAELSSGAPKIVRDRPWPLKFLPERYTVLRK